LRLPERQLRVGDSHLIRVDQLRVAN
jgi:hypothetical protein